MLLGRERELAVLVDACRAAEARRGSAVLVLGEPGSKTTDAHGSVGATTGTKGAPTIKASKAGYVSAKGRA